MTPRQPIPVRSPTPVPPQARSYWSPGSHITPPSQPEYGKTSPQIGECSYFLIEKKSPKTTFFTKPFKKYNYNMYILRGIDLGFKKFLHFEL